MLIQVTQEGIDSGELRTSTRCAIAKALQRQTGAPLVNVGKVLGFTKESTWLWYHLVPEAGDFVRQFDAGRSVPSLTFIAEHL